MAAVCFDFTRKWELIDFSEPCVFLFVVVLFLNLIYFGLYTFLFFW